MNQYHYSSASSPDHLSASSPWHPGASAPRHPGASSLYHPIAPARQRPGFPASQFPGSALQAYRQLAAALLDSDLQTRSQVGGSSFGLVSSNRREGCSSVAANLSITLVSETTKNVLLIDADLESPGAAYILGAHQGPGLCEIVRGEALLDQVIVPTDADRLWVLRAGYLCQGERAGNVLDAPEARELFKQVKQLFDMVIFDLPPADSGPGAKLVAPHLDGAVIVIKSRSTRKVQVEKTMDLVGRSRVIGFAMSFCTDEIPRWLSERL